MASRRRPEISRVHARQIAAQEITHYWSGVPGTFDAIGEGRPRSKMTGSLAVVFLSG